ncbi:hypothetical protein EDD21DRAFT_360654 [Dissophora ornata]|nr:hypothetical protein EDD21DRAFT_360654 [Dissophora ornata]
MRKLVVQRRGGYCLELNSLLGEALEVLGFSVERATAKIVRGSSLLSKQLAREKNSDLNESDIHELEVFPHDESGWETHQMLLVGVPASSESVRYEKYLVDAGLAKYSILEPIALSSTLADEGHHQYQGALGKRFRIAPAVDQATETESGRRWNLSVKFPGSRIWFPYYTFKAQEASAQQIDMIHYYMSMTPSSTRPAEPFATMPTCDGERQVTLQGLTLTIEQIEGGTEKERVVEVTTLKNEEEQREYFQRYFGIEGYQAGTVLVKAT